MPPPTGCMNTINTSDSDPMGLIRWQSKPINAPLPAYTSLETVGLSVKPTT